MKLEDDDRPGCPLCDDTVDTDTPNHGCCLVYGALGPLAKIVALDDDDPHCGLTRRQAAATLEAMSQKYEFDELAAGEIPLDRVRRDVAMARAIAHEDWATLAKLNPRHAGLMMAAGIISPEDLAKP